jgi:hypothetical protein
VRQLIVRARWKASWLVTLLPGAIVTVAGYGNWQLLSMRSVWDRRGPAGLTEYEGQRVS